MAHTSSVSGNGPGAGWFPSWFLWPLFFLTSAVRVYYVLQPNNWWILHPDEVYQALEVAHSEMYGYGFRAYEYNPPVEVGQDTPHIRALEQKHGMAALRSYLLPHAYVTVTWVLQLLGLHFNPFLTWKVAHTLAACALPLAVYRYARAAFRSHDTACLAAILTASSAHLHVLGTHTLVNSLLAAPVFWVLSHLHALVSPPPGPPPSLEKADEGKTQTNGKASAKDQPSQPSPSRHQSNHSRTKGKPKHQRTGQKQRPAPSANGSTHRGTEMRNGLKHESTARADGTEKLDINRNGSLGVGEGLGARQTSSGMRSTKKELADSDSAPCTDSVKQRCAAVLQNLGVGLVLGMCVYIRIDVSALLVLALLPHWRPLRTRYIDVIVCALGAVGGVVVGVLDDFWCYGWGVLTPYNWYRFNVENDYSSLVFGTNDINQYILDIFFDNVGMMLLSAVCCLCAVVHLVHHLRSSAGALEKDLEEAGPQPSWRGVTVRTCVSWLCLLVLYSSKGHKEMRFVHNVIVLILVTWAALIRSSLRRVWESAGCQKHALTMVLVLFALSQYHDVATLTGDSSRGGNKRGFKEAGDTQDINQCLYHLSTRDDVTGVFLDRNLYATGGYSLLHRDVPIFTIFGNSFLEFRKEDRMVERAKDLLGPARNISVAYAGQFSNYLAKQHSSYVFKFVLEDPRYNYIVALAKRNFAFFGLGEPVFRCGLFKIYRRPDNPTPEQRLQMQETLNVPQPSNGSLLLHEADTLVYYGAWRRARDRFRLALNADPTLVGAYLPLAATHFRLKEEEMSHAVMEECYARFSREKCEEKRPAMIDVNQLPVMA